jgi:polyisoprenoid-binding protein YceI
MSVKQIVTLAFAAATVLSSPLHAQKLFTRSAKVSFDATAPKSPETVKAVSKSGTCVLDKSAGAVEMAVLIKGFLFEKALMEEHFNENYLESSKYPKATFKGKFDNPASVDTGKDGEYKVTVNGTLEMHGVSKAVNAPVVFTVKNKKLSATANFSVALSDYKIEIPSLVADKLSKTANVSIAADFEPMK